MIAGTIKPMNKSNTKLYAGLTKENFYFACTPLSQKTTGLNMILYVCPNFIKGLKPRLWVQNNYEKYSDNNILPFDIEIQKISKYFRKPPIKLTDKDFLELKRFILLNKKLLLSIWNQKPYYSSTEILGKIKSVKK